MKRVFLLLSSFIFSVVCFSQNTLVATLTHGEEISMFYGTQALQDAFNAAADGDVINLSGGAFQSVDITKAVSVRGAGADTDDATYILGEFRIEIPENATGRLSFEGCCVKNNIYIRGTLLNASFLKCVLQFIGSEKSPVVKGCTFANCQLYYIGSFRDICSFQFVNCYVKHFRREYSSSFLNCVIVDEYDKSTSLASAQLTNSIIVVVGYYRYYFSPAAARNCVVVASDNETLEHETFDAITERNCSCGLIDAFIDSDPMKDLTEEAKAKYIGTDGTPVGMYGGLLPYNMTPSYPQITKMNVASKTTADGKLSVEIEVSAVHE